MDLVSRCEMLAWCVMFAGASWGAALGFGFHRDAWLGGYGSFRRRLLRLGHMSCFGLPFVTLFAVQHARSIELGPDVTWGCVALSASMVTMPLTCALTAVEQRWRHFFAVPVIAFLTGAGFMVAAIVGRDVVG